METKEVKIGTSLLVPCVQELAKEHNIKGSVPSRNIPSHLDPVITHHHHEVPGIDFQRLLSQESVDSESTTLYFVCREWGFFQLVNHGVSHSLLERLKTEVQEFFNLPMEEKKKFWQYPGEVQGFGQAFVVSEEQTLGRSVILGYSAC